MLHLSCSPLTLGDNLNFTHPNWLINWADLTHKNMNRSEKWVIFNEQDKLIVAYSFRHISNNPNHQDHSFHSCQHNTANLWSISFNDSCNHHICSPHDYHQNNHHYNRNYHQEVDVLCLIQCSSPFIQPDFLESGYKLLLQVIQDIMMSSTLWQCSLSLSSSTLWK